MTYEEMHAVAQYLYQLLDDIDTATDIAKSDDKLYRGIVERTQAKKAHVVAECDGYTVTLRPLTANVAGNRLARQGQSELTGVLARRNEKEN